MKINVSNPFCQLLWKCIMNTEDAFTAEVCVCGGGSGQADRIMGKGGLGFEEFEFENPVKILIV